MTSLYPLIRNETVKIWKKRRFHVIILILLVLIPIFTYAQMRVAQTQLKQTGSSDWRVATQTRVQDYTSRLSSPRIPEEWKESIKVEVQRLQYYLDRDIDPQAPNGVTFTRVFLANSINLFLPLMVMVIASDMVSSEHATGTIKLLLTRPVRRWKVLFSKLVALIFYVSMIVLATTVVSYLISGLVFGFSGWTHPVLTGFRINGSEVDTSRIQVVPQWLFLLMTAGLAWFSALVVAILSLMVSVLIRSTAAGMGVMLAAIIAGTILSNMVSSWETAKYFFMVNLETTVYLNGTVPPIKGMTLPFSLAVLSVWAACALYVSFRVFTRKDVLN
ncbi:ABC transporter permease [Paenibacillus turpanensis]|uniref:ABC transporter permease n=1 Tax=Paenibacillus turpanensis TaxID=2689078 RepID=UPI0014085B1E|nr:ABC transporter permease [Paenibacillus turpanensis]